MLIPLDRLLFPPNPPAGMDWAVVGSLVTELRKTPRPCDPPILVRPERCACTPADCPAHFWRITDGRHRFVAALFAGRTHIEAELGPT